jgi:hypothetical protein
LKEPTNVAATRDDSPVLETAAQVRVALERTCPTWEGKLLKYDWRMKMADAAIDQAEAVNSNNRVTKVMVLEALQALLQESPGGDGPGYVDVGKRAGLSASTARKWIRRLARDGKLPARYVVPSLHAKKKGLHGDTAQERMAVEANIAEIRQTKEDRAAPAWEVPEVRVSARLRSLL